MNPRRLAVAGMACAVIAGIIAANLWRELQVARERISGLQAELAGSATRQPVPQPAAPTRDTRPDVPQSPHPQPVIAAHDNAAAKDLLQDPEYREARLQADGYAAALAAAGMPLDTTQLREVALAMAGEQKSLKQDIVALARTVDLSNPGTQLDAQYALKRRQAESSRRVLDAVYGSLGPQQLDLLRDFLERQDAGRR